MSTIFHLALASDWAAAQRSGAYTTSTLGRTLAEEGFIHASRADQWTGVRERFYAEVTEPLVLLHIDTDRLDVPVVEEPPAPGVEETFPHIYGRLPVTAVVKAIPLPSGTTPPAPAAGESFSSVFLGEMFFNVLVACIALAGSVLGLAVGLALDRDWAPGVLGLVGLAAGVVVATKVYRRRHPRVAA